MRRGRNLVPVSVNVSMTDIEAIDVARVLGDLLDRFSIDARLLQVEITESAIAHNMDVVEETIRDLHARGIAVLMDDFGSAYSSLNMLKDINVDAIKLDMKFVDLNADNAAKGLKNHRIRDRHGLPAETVDHCGGCADRRTGEQAA